MEKKMDSRLFLSATAALVVAHAGSALAQPAQQRSGLEPPPGPCPVYKSAEVGQHIDRAYTLIGNDLPQGLIPSMFIVPRGSGLCSPPRVPQFNRSSAVAEPVRAFDQLYFMGNGFVGAWALRTSDGIILFDSMNNSDDVAKVIEPSFEKLGLDPRQIKYIIISHGHGDHWGGAATLQQKYGAKVWVGDKDALIMPAPGTGRVSAPRVDRAVADGTLLTLGDTTVKLYVTSGHTPGSLSAIFPVTDNGVSHKVAIFGGYGIPNQLNPDPNTPQRSAGLLTYISQAERFRELGRAEGVDVGLSTHPIFDDTIQKIDLVSKSRPRTSPWVLGRDGWLRFSSASIEVAKTVEAMIREHGAPAQQR